jgi:hypothetical protein
LEIRARDAGGDEDIDVLFEVGGDMNEELPQECIDALLSGADGKQRVKHRQKSSSNSQAIISSEEIESLFGTNDLAHLDEGEINRDTNSRPPGLTQEEVDALLHW